MAVLHNDVLPFDQGLDLPLKAVLAVTAPCHHAEHPGLSAVRPHAPARLAAVPARQKAGNDAASGRASR